MIKKIFNFFGYLIKLIFKALFLFLKSLKFIFRIPFTSLIAMIFSLGLIIVYRSLNILLDIIFEALFSFDLSANFNYGLIDSLIASVIYIILNVLLFNDKLKNDEHFKPRRALLYYAPTIILWMIPIYLLQDLATDTILFLSHSAIDLFEPTYSYILIAFAGPHFWPAMITGQAKAIAIGIAINSFIYVIYSLIVVQKLEIPSES